MEEVAATGDHRDVDGVQDNRCGRRHCKSLVDLQDAREKCRPANQDQVRQHDHGQLQRQDAVGQHFLPAEHEHAGQQNFAGKRQPHENQREQVHRGGREAVGFLGRFVAYAL